MSLKIILSVSFGIVLGLVLKDSFIVEMIGLSSTFILNALLFFVGIDIGQSKESFKDVKKHLKGVLTVTTGTILGTLVGGLVTGLIFQMAINETLSVSAGFGWYSLSGVILTNLGNAQLGSMAFLSNVFRELIAVLSIPYLAKHLGFLSAIGPSGATSMDTTLPLISKNTDESATIVAFLNGVILSSIVPILVPIIYNL
jgi:uncharacterized membrane protein YbjE (DUF340 family)